VDHVQFSVADPDRAAAELTAVGYEVQFRQEQFDRDVPGFFRESNKTMVFLRGGSTFLELISASASPGPGTYEPVFDDRAPSQHVACLSARCRGAPRSPLQSVNVRVCDLERSRSFWTALGFRPSGAAGDATLTFLAGPMGMPLTIRLDAVPDAPVPAAEVDDLGCSLVALIEINIGRLLGALASLAHVRKRGRFTIAGKNLESVMIAGPSGELVELLCLQRRASPR
jgi:catechol 2,3-dioxygenase-like lactoylglutathione lyase family enzyme